MGAATAKTVWISTGAGLAATGIAGLIGAAKVTMALVGGGVFLAVALGYGGYRIYKYYNGKVEVHKELLENFSEEQIRIIAHNVPAWKKIDVSDEELRLVKKITLDCLQKKIAEYTCPITLQVTREPVQVPCCLRFFEKASITTVLTTAKKCPNCREKLTVDKLILDKFEREDAIQQMRFQIWRAYRDLTTVNQQRDWLEVIQKGMGQGYEI